jgi:alginate O-acetyltransferase complex protein AlgJ
MLIGLFGVFLLLPLLDLAFHLDPTSPQSENRVLAPLPPPPAGVVGVKKFLTGWEAYFGDHFGCRRVLIMWHNKLKWSLFKEKSVRNVLVGSEGWMFYSANQMIEHYRGALQFTPAELDGWQQLLERRRDWLARRGIGYLFVIAPDKQSVYSEFLPAWLKDLGGRTTVDQFLAHMKAHSTVEVLDLRPVLLAAKKSQPVYQKTDTHWNQLGAFFACEDVIRALAEHQMPRLACISLAAFSISNGYAPGGDLARGMGVSMAESQAPQLVPKPELPALETYIPVGEHIKDMAFAKNPHGSGLAMVYHDSFGRYWVPFLGYQFAEADFFWQYHLDGQIINRQKPVVVVTEMLERFFNVTDPKELSARDTLP